MNVRRAILLAVSLAAIVPPAPALAQDAGDTGLVMSYPTTVGVVVHLSERFALRPEVNLTVARTKTESGFTSVDGDTWAVGTGVSAIFYLRQFDKLRTYLSPRYSYTRAENTTSSVVILLMPEVRESTLVTRSHAVTGTFGAQYALHDRFSVFGEVGGGYTRQRSESAVVGGRSSGHQFSTRSSVGVIFYF